MRGLTLTIRRIDGSQVEVDLSPAAEYLLVEVNGGKAWSGCGEILIREVVGSVIPAKQESEKP